MYKHVRRVSHSTMLLALIIACSMAINALFIYLLWDTSNVATQTDKELKTANANYTDVAVKYETLSQENAQLKTGKEALQKQIDNMPK